MKTHKLSALAISLFFAYGGMANAANDIQGVRMYGPITYTTGTKTYQQGGCYDQSGNGPYTVTVTQSGTLENYYQYGWGIGPASAMIYGGYASYSAPCYPPYWGGGCCFPAGSKIMLPDGTQAAIEVIRPGDIVMGADGFPARIEEVHLPLLNDRAMMKMPDGSHFWSDEHAHWTRDADGLEWWWSANPQAWREEAESGLIGGLFDNDTLRSGGGVEFAHLGGWSALQPVVAEGFGPETQLYLPRTNGVGIIVNGYVVGSGVNEHNYPYRSFRWSPEMIWAAITKAALRRIIATQGMFAAKLDPVKLEAI